MNFSSLFLNCHMIWIFKSIIKNDGTSWSQSCDSAPHCIIHTFNVDMPLVRRFENHCSCDITPVLITWHIAAKCQALQILQNVQETVLFTNLRNTNNVITSICHKMYCFHILSLPYFLSERCRHWALHCTTPYMADLSLSQHTPPLIRNISQCCESLHALTTKQAENHLLPWL